MATEARVLRRKFRQCPIEDYILCQRKVDYIQSKQPSSYKGINKGDEYRLYWEQIFRHCPDNYRDFLSWNVGKFINRIDAVISRGFDSLPKRDWGDSYDPEEGGEEEEIVLDYMWSGVRKKLRAAK